MAKYQAVFSVANRVVIPLEAVNLTEAAEMAAEMSTNGQAAEALGIEAESLEVVMDFVTDKAFSLKAEGYTCPRCGNDDEEALSVMTHAEFWGGRCEIEFSCNKCNLTFREHYNLSHVEMFDE